MHDASPNSATRSPSIRSPRYEPERVSSEKSARDRLIRLAASHPTWALGFQDEVWWSRLARPSLQTWVEADDRLRLVEQAVAIDDPDPKAVACYGLLLRADLADEHTTDQLWLRFVDGHPVSPATIEYLDWCCRTLHAAGKEALLLIWDNAPWPGAKERDSGGKVDGRNPICCVVSHRRQSQPGGSCRRKPCILCDNRTVRPEWGVRVGICARSGRLLELFCDSRRQQRRLPGSRRLISPADPCYLAPGDSFLSIGPPWHVSHQVRDWIRDHNRQVKQQDADVRIIAGYLPSRSPWLNAIEATWVHGKRRVIEADGLLTISELAARVCDAYGCPHEPHLAIPQKVA
jgi:hypothetical protein